MWFEIIPSFTIITLALSAPGFALYGLHKLTIGNAYRRGLECRWDRVMYVRDKRLTGSPYVQNGLDAIPDAQ